MWTCCRSGHCCEQVREVVMTLEERTEIERATPPGVALSFADHDDPRFTRLLAAPCPLYRDHGCSVYAVRPYNCRRYGCFRENVQTEPLQVANGLPLAVLATRENRRTYARMQRKAQRWGRAHGWED